MPELAPSYCAACGTAECAADGTRLYRYATPIRLEPRRSYEPLAGDGNKFALITHDREPWVCGACAIRAAAESQLHTVGTK